MPDSGRAFNRQVATHSERLDAIEEQLTALGDVGTAKTTKEQKLAAICAFARNKGGQSGTVAVTASDIQGCIGVSRRYAYDLIDEAAEELDGARIREGTEVKTSTGVEHKKKALLVDCEVVHTAAEAVNKFTTGIGVDAPQTSGESQSEEGSSG